MSKSCALRPHAEIFEKVPVCVHASPAEAAGKLAAEVRLLIESRKAEGRNAVLGLATGSTPVPFYRELIRLHREEGLSFQNVVTFNLDEYYGLPPEHPESYARFMADQLFSHIDIPQENIHIPSGLVPGNQVFSHCRDYEEAITHAGGIDLQILGIGRTGHIGFNEPGSSKDSLTRRITLDRVTRQDAAGDFRGEQNVPHFAITMGVGTILRGKKLVLMAWGENKAGIVARAVEGPVTDAISASFLQDHPDARFFIDQKASTELVRFKLPWLVGPAAWSPAETLRAVCWMSAKLKQPVLKLVDEDYNENGLSDLLSDQGPAYQLNIRVFNRLQNTITGWPGGKPNEDDTYRPEKAKPYPKMCLIFSPEPQDAVVAMAGTMERLREQGNQVRLVNLTSGSLRVSDSEADKFTGTLNELATCANDVTAWSSQKSYADEILSILSDKVEGGEDPQVLRHLKSLILRGECRDAAHTLRIASEDVQFLDLPFYEKGRYRQLRPSAADVERVVSLLREHRPNQIYITGHNSDPSSVSAVSFGIVMEALHLCQNEEWSSSCSIWLYAGKERPLSPHEIGMAVPMSPAQMERKQLALARFQQLTSLEMLAPERDRSMARQYDELGLAQYEAIECFQRWSKR